MRPLVSLALVGALSLAGTSVAHAWCRTTTTPADASYNPVQDGCLSGTPLAWDTMPVAYQIYQGVGGNFTLAETTAVVDRAFSHWPAASCSTTDASSHPSLSVRDDGPTDAPDPCVTAPCSVATNAAHGIYFRDDSWPYDDASNEIALTTVTYGVDDGKIFAAVMELNSHRFTFSTDASPAPGDYSLEAVVTHEAGHFVGMAHSQVEDAIMYAYYAGTSPSLTPDDEGGICAIYPPASPSSGCSCQAAPAAEPGWPVGVLGLLGVAAFRRKRRYGGR